jgi:hypothetical protein
VSDTKLKNHVPVMNYDDIYAFELKPSVILLKIRVIQELIQIARPRNWNDDNMLSLLNDLIETERYIAYKNFNLKLFLSKWNLLQ